MNRAGRQAVRIWVAIIAAYAVLVQILAPLPAADLRLAGSDPLLVLCDGATADDGSPDRGGHAHGALCCILCTTATVAALPAAGEPIEPVALAVAAIGYPADRSGEPRAPPERAPIVPRGPPSHA